MVVEHGGQQRNLRLSRCEPSGGGGADANPRRCPELVMGLQLVWQCFDGDDVPERSPTTIRLHLLRHSASLQLTSKTGKSRLNTEALWVCRHGAHEDFLFIATIYRRVAEIWILSPKTRPLLTPLLPSPNNAPGFPLSDQLGLKP